ncbi:MAG: methionyl-tRNA formyltransferase [Pedosphaera sp.]|nr:methionyl-tRNA formyltransferase [Pedosphaera sp.]
MTPLKTIFFGTAELACASLAALARDSQFQLVAVVTQPDKAKGRDLKIQPTPVKAEALKLGLPVLQPVKAHALEFIAELARLQPDIIIVAAYGQILPQSILDLPRLGCLNVHTSLLPNYRGAAPIQWAILNGDAESGVTIMKMDAGLDTGDILTQSRTTITEADNAQTLHDRLAGMGAELLIGTVPQFAEGKIIGQRQPVEGFSYARKISKEDGRLEWSQPARTLWNRVRGLTPWPGAFTFLSGESRQTMLKIWEADVIEGIGGSHGEVLRADKEGIIVACGASALRVLQLQREGGRRLRAGEFLMGHPVAPGTRFST